MNLLINFLKARGLPIGTVRNRRGGKFIKVSDGKWQRYSSEHRRKKGLAVKEKKRGRKAKSGQPRKTLHAFNVRKPRKLRDYLDKGRVTYYQASKGIPKSGKVIFAHGSNVLGEAYTKKGAERFLKLHKDSKGLYALAYKAKRGRPKSYKLPKTQAA